MTLALTVRYFQDSTPTEIACREEHFIRREIEMALPVSQTALVLVDLWNTHFIESWLERAKQIMREAVVPVVDAARRCGLTIIHAPSPEVGAQYSQLEHHAVAPTPSDPGWPPVAFRQRSGDYAAFKGPRQQPPSIGIHWDTLASQLAMSPEIQVLEGETVIATGQQLHDYLAQRQVLHLIYAGFATNWCILNRDYGMRAMARRGYNLVLLREATMGVEFPDTLPTQFATEMAIREVEQQCGFTASNASFLSACRNLMA